MPVDAAVPAVWDSADEVICASDAPAKRVPSVQSARVSNLTAEEQLAQIERLLDDGVGRQNLEDLTLVERVQDVIAAFNSWSELAIKRLHEIHRLTGEECEWCPKWLDT